MNQNNPAPHHDLKDIARRAMLARGLAPDFEPQALAELATLHNAAAALGGDVRDMRSLLWCSIDNDSSRDLDQLTVAEILPGTDAVKIFVAIADVDALVRAGGAIDAHAKHNTTSVYTPAAIFAMLPEKLSTDLTSLNGGEDRLSIVIEMVVNSDGTIASSDVYRAAVHNYAKLAYNSVAAWLKGGPAPAALAAVKGMDEQIRIQDRVAQTLKNLRHEHGALSLQTIQPSAVYVGDQLTDIKVEEANRAKELIEDFMIAANGVTANFLKNNKLPSLRRVVREPERWQRIVDVAKTLGGNLPAQPDSEALEDFLSKRKIADPMRFPDLSLTIVKLMGRGEYTVDLPGENVPGHFGLAVKDYTHSTAPNRRYPDLLTQRMLKAGIAGKPSPYSNDELTQLAKHCTDMEDAASKVERQVRKSCAALLLETKVGQTFDCIVTGASNKGTYVRCFAPPVEGRITRGFEGLDVGERVTVRLDHVDVEHGFIDFSNAKAHV